jgi:cytochrome c
MTIRAVLALMLLLSFAAFRTELNAQTPPEETFGKVLVQKNCAACHAIGHSDRSKHPAAPPFTQIFKRYLASVLAEALAEGLSTGHPDMPEFTFGPRETAAIIRYFESLSR